MIRPIASIAAVCCLSVLVAACGSDSGGSPSSSPPPQSSADPASAQPADSASPVAAAPAGDTQAADAQAQDDNQYGQPAPETRERDDPQAAWKMRRDSDAASAAAAANDTPAG